MNKFKCPECGSTDLSIGRDFFPHIHCLNCDIIQEVKSE